MRKNVFGRQFKRDKNERKALFKALMSSLVLHGRIQTTEAKAKAIKGQIEKLVTKAKNGGLNAHRLIQPFLMPYAVDKMVKEVAPFFKERSGGYTRILRLGRRTHDSAEMVAIEWVESIENQNSKLKNQSDKPALLESPKEKSDKKKVISNKKEPKTKKTKI